MTRAPKPAITLASRLLIGVRRSTNRKTSQATETADFAASRKRVSKRTFLRASSIAVCLFWTRGGASVSATHVRQM